MPPPAPRTPPPTWMGFALLVGAAVAVGGAIGAGVIGNDDGPRPAAVSVPADPGPVVVALPTQGGEPGDVPESTAPAPLPPPVASTTPAPVTPPAPVPAPQRPTTVAPQAPGPPPPSTTRPRVPVAPPARTAPGTAPAPAPAPTTTAAPTVTTPPATPVPPLAPYVPPPTVRIPAGALADTGEARAELRALAGDTAVGVEERGDIAWVLRLDRELGGEGAPAGRRATIARALQANAWWFATRRSPARRVVVRDPDGVLLTYRAGQGFVVNPVATTGRWRGLNDDVSAEGLADALLPMGVARSAGDRGFLAWEYFDVPDAPGVMRPGVSGMAQARVAEMMAVAYHRTGEARFLDTATLALAGLTVPVDRGGALSAVRLDGWDAPGTWFVERAYPDADPWKGGALNGFMVTLLSLRNVAARLGTPPTATAAAVTTTAGVTAPAPPDPELARRGAAGAQLATSLAERGARTLRDALPAHDVGDWSLYGLLTPGHAPRTYRADLNYHCYHVYLLNALAPLYPGMGFATVAARWQGYVDRRDLTCPAR